MIVDKRIKSLAMIAKDAGSDGRDLYVTLRGGKLYACNGSQLLQIDNPSVGSDEEVPETGVKAVPLTVSDEAIFNHGQIEKAWKAVDNKSTLPILRNVQLAKKENGRSLVVTTDLESVTSVQCSTDVDPANQPDYEGLWNRLSGEPKAAASFSLKELDLFIQAVKAAGFNSRLERVHVTLSLRGCASGMAIYVKSPETHGDEKVFRGIIMPTKDDELKKMEKEQERRERELVGLAENLDEKAAA